MQLLKPKTRLSLQLGGLAVPSSVSTQVMMIMTFMIYSQKLQRTGVQNTHVGRQAENHDPLDNFDMDYTQVLPKEPIIWMF